MLEENHKDGLIGRDAGTRVKTLPSAIYWNGLKQFGVLRPGTSPDAIGRPVESRDVDDGAQDEQTDRVDSMWHPSIPPPPNGFPKTVAGGFGLTVDEATWFRDLTLRNAPGTLLAHLMASDDALGPEIVAPWTDPVARTAPEQVLDLLEEARRFSLVMHGAALLYNLLLGEAYEAAGHTTVTEPAERYRADLEAWSSEVAASGAELASWDFDPWWNEVVSHNRRIGPRTRDFVADWLDITRAIGDSGVAVDSRARTLIQNRERATKRGQARLANGRLLKAWNGASGTRPLTYRWSTVHRLVSDVIEEIADSAGA
jgi:hypothetical protein